MTYSVQIKPSAKKEIKEVQKPYLNKVIQAISDLAENPRPQGCKKLVNTKENLWRIRIGDYRIVYLIEDIIKIIEVRNVRHRKDVYDAL